MSELKVFRFLGFDEIHPDAKMGSLYYRKSQVDELIERKDKAFEYSQAVILVDIEIIKKQKRKRCLAMGKWCKAEQDAAFLRYNWDTGRYDDVDFYEKWYNRWLALAVEPTWAKFLQLIHKEGK